MADLLFFNPGCELEVASGLPNYSLQKHPAILESDLSVLPMFISCPGDYVAARTSDKSFVDYWRDIYPCTFTGFGGRQIRSVELGKFRPWGISPRALHLAGGLSFSRAYMESPVSSFTPEHRRLFSRETSADFFRRLRPDGLLSADLITPPDSMPVIARSLNEAEDFFHQAAARRSGGSVFKAVYGSSGRGVRILRDCRFTPGIAGWIKSCISQHGSIACEYLFNKVSDFSMHYDIAGGKARFVGVSQFSTADTGAYLGSLVRRLASIPGFSGFSANALSAMHISALNDSVFTRIYEGPLGIDCMVYSDGGRLMVNPCVEINCRNSMGRLAMELFQLTDPDCECRYYVYQKDRPLPGMEQKPVFLNGRLAGGFLPLTPSDTRMFAAGIISSPCPRK